MKVNYDVSVKFQSITFIAEAVAMVSKEDYVQAEEQRYWPTTPIDQRREMLAEVHKLCTEACEQAGIKLSTVPAKAEKKKKPKLEGSKPAKAKPVAGTLGDEPPKP